MGVSSLICNIVGGEWTVEGLESGHCVVVVLLIIPLLLLHIQKSVLCIGQWSGVPGAGQQC